MKVAASFVLAGLMLGVATIVAGCSQVPGAPMINVGTVTVTQGSTIAPGGLPPAPASAPQPICPPVESTLPCKPGCPCGS